MEKVLSAIILTVTNILRQIFVISGVFMKLRFLTITFLMISGIANAGEWSYNTEGQIKSAFGYADVKKEDKYRGNINAEINSYIAYDFNDEYAVSVHFDLMSGIDRDLQNYNQGHWGEELYGIFNSPFGQIITGQTFNVGAQFFDGAPMIGILSNNSDVVNFISNPNWKRTSKQTKFATLNTTYINTDGVAPKISYISPELYGSGFGLSYIPKIYNRRGLINNHAPYKDDDGYVGAFYHSQDIGGLNINTSISFAKFSGDDKEFSASALLSYGNWSLGAGWRKSYIEGKEKTSLSDFRLAEFFDGYREGYAWDLGLGYKFGPYKTGISYFQSKAENSDNQDQIVTFSNRYQINNFFDIYFATAYVNFEDENANTTEGMAVVGGIGFNF